MSNSLKRWLHSLTTLDSIILFLISATIFFIVFNFKYTGAYNLFTSNADILFIEEVARDLNAGASLFDWRLTQAPYLFPDIFLSRIVAYFVPDTGEVAGVYTTLFGIMLASLVYWLTKTMRMNPILPVFIAVFFYLFMYSLGLSGDYVSQYFGMIGCHAGISIPLLLIMIGAVMYFDSHHHSPGALLLIFVSLFIGTISDSIVAFATVPFLSAFLFLLWHKKEIEIKPASQIFAGLVITVLIAKAFGYTNPFPQDRAFMAYVLHHFPESTLISLKQFPTDFFKYFTSSPVSALIALSYFYSFYIALRHILKCFQTDLRANTSETLLASFILISPIFVILLQITLGIYQDIHHSRQWSPLIYLSIIFGTILFERLQPQKTLLFKKIFVLLLIMNLLFITYLFSKHKKQLAPPNEILPFVACMKEHHLPEGQLYISDYWIARPIRMYSNYAYDVVAMDGWSKDLPTIYSFTSNIKKIRNATPQYLITGFSVDEEKIVSQFGKPKAEYCTMVFHGQNVKIMDYSDNPNFKNRLKDEAMKSK